MSLRFSTQESTAFEVAASMAQPSALLHIVKVLATKQLSQLLTLAGLSLLWVAL